MIHRHNYSRYICLLVEVQMYFLDMPPNNKFCHCTSIIFIMPLRFVLLFNIIWKIFILSMLFDFASYWSTQMLQWYSADRFHKNKISDMSPSWHITDMNIHYMVERCISWNCYTNFIHRYLHIAARAKMILTPQKCCCFLTLKTGTIIIGVLELVSADFLLS